jgi:hypothetical protein
MMDDKHPFAPAPAAPEECDPVAQAPEERGRAAHAPDVGETPDSANPGVAAPAAATAPPTAASAAVLKFKSCRWRCDPEAGEFCTHRDVLPFAGKEGFNAESWCPECEYYKLRRTPRKRERVDYTY